MTASLYIHQLDFLEEYNNTKEVEINMRWKHWDQTKPWESVKYDNVTIIITSSGEKKSAYCDFSSLSIASGTGMTQNRSYKVGSGDNDGKKETYLITTKFDGLDQLSDECQDQIYLSFDVQKPNSDYWETISFEGETENDYYDHMEYVYDEITGELIEAIRWGVYLDLSDDSFSYIVAKATQEIFVE